MIIDTKGKPGYNPKTRFQVKPNKKVFSSVRISSIAHLLREWAPVKIVLNGNVVWDDEAGDSIEEYNSIMNYNDTIASIKFEIVHFHHSIVYIETI